MSNFLLSNCPMLTGRYKYVFFEASGHSYLLLRNKISLIGIVFVKLLDVCSLEAIVCTELRTADFQSVLRLRLKTENRMVLLLRTMKYTTLSVNTNSLSRGTTLAHHSTCISWHSISQKQFDKAWSLKGEFNTQPII